MSDFRVLGKVPWQPIIEASRKLASGQLGYRHQDARLAAVHPFENPIVSDQSGLKFRSLAVRAVT